MAGGQYNPQDRDWLIWPSSSTSGRAYMGQHSNPMFSHSTPTYSQSLRTPYPIWYGSVYVPTYPTGETLNALKVNSQGEESIVKKEKFSSCDIQPRAADTEEVSCTAMNLLAMVSSYNYAIEQSKLNAETIIKA
jgi:hypothetical protein